MNQICFLTCVTDIPVSLVMNSTSRSAMCSPVSSPSPPTKRNLCSSGFLPVILIDEMSEARETTAVPWMSSSYTGASARYSLRNLAEFSKEKSSNWMNVLCPNLPWISLIVSSINSL